MEVLSESVLRIADALLSLDSRFLGLTILYDTMVESGVVDSYRLAEGAGTVHVDECIL